MKHLTFAAAAVVLAALAFGSAGAQSGSSSAPGRAAVAEPFRSLFAAFLSAYLARSGDFELLEVLPPFLMFRALVIAHPCWYPALTDPTRRALLDFARGMADAPAFDPEHLPAELGGVT